jgi:inner membrane protein
VDNLCHTLTGAALGEAGLKRRTRYGNVALMISANLPDVDVLVFATDTLPVSFRRGWTHGVIAQLLLPIALTLGFVLVGRWRRSRSGDTGPPVHAGWLLALSYAGVFSHVGLDYLNNYGVRLLAPFDWRWFYGDAVFIVDPVLWLALGAGVWLARRQHARVPALGALVFAVGYIVLMLLSAGAARDYVARAWRTTRGIEPRAMMVGPAALTPLSKEIIVDAGDRYESGAFSWWPPAVTFRPEAVPKNSHRPEVEAAIASSEDVRGFLVWSRFPYWTLAPAEGGVRVTVQDMRFRLRGGFTVSTVVASEAD